MCIFRLNYPTCKPHAPYYTAFRDINDSYLHTPWCRVLLEKLTGLQLVKKFPAFHGTRRFITALTSFRQLSLSWASPIQSIYPHPTTWRTILILSTHLRLGLSSGLLPSGFLTKTLYTPSPHPYAPHAQPIYGIKKIKVKVKVKVKATKTQRGNRGIAVLFF